MQPDERQFVAVCGLDCATCDIRLLPTDAAAAGRVIGWFRNQGWLEENEGMPEVIERCMYCKGCRGDRAVHWSADCEILRCCVDEKGLEFCYECDEFVCNRLGEWAQRGSKYAEGVERLKRMKAGGAA